MNTNDLIVQYHRLQLLGDNAQRIAETLADQVWDSFESDIEECTETGFTFDFVELTKATLTDCLAQYCQDMFDRDVLPIFEEMQSQLTNLGDEKAIDLAQIDLDAVRIGIKLRRHAEELIGDALHRAKPGFERALSVIIGGMFQDPIEQTESLERDMEKDAKAARRELIKLRDQLHTLIAEDTRQLIQRGWLIYQGGLGRLQTKITLNDGDTPLPTQKNHYDPRDKPRP